jgi:Mg2+/Co2+ transporter CorB
MIAYALGNVALIAGMTRMAGPFNFVPALACVVLMSATAYPAFITRPWLLLGMIALGFLTPIILELTDQLPRTWEIANNELVSHAGALKIEGTPTLIMLIVASLVTMMIAGVLAARIYRAGRDAQRQLVRQAWHLGHLLPSSRASQSIRMPVAS